MRLTLRDKAGYAAAGIADSANYTFMNSYALFFLTTIAGINPATAGFLVAAGSMVSSFWGPVIGFLSDGSATRFGKRRPFLMAASLPLAFSLICCFTKIDSADTFKNVYYGIMIVMFWCSFTTFYSPWLALGAEYTSDYSERTELRSATYGITLTGTVFGIAVPPVVIDGLESIGIPENRAWQIMAAMIAFIALCGLGITIISSAKKDKPVLRQADGADASAERRLSLRDIKELFKNYWEIFRLRPTKFVIGACLCHITAQGIFFSDRLYFFTYNLGLSAGEITLVMLAFPLSGVLTLAPVLKVSKLLDKRSALITFMVIASSGCILMGKIIGIEGFWGAVAMTFVFVIGNSAFWQLMPVMIYDICEYDEYQNNKRREGIIVSMQNVMETLCSGLATMVLGGILQLSGFDKMSQVQTESALSGVSLALYLVPAVLMLGCAFMTYKYPITKQVFKELKEAIAERKKQEKERADEYDADGL